MTAGDTGAGPVETPNVVDRPNVIERAMRTGTLSTLWGKLQPDVPAIVSPHGTRTFAELNARANQLVRALQARGVEPGSTIALVCSNRPEFVETYEAVRAKDDL